ncbi:diguanylate cyclase [Roseateles asaccharophilus]|uniref:diguanylate cyclase n=1 Tax=Roseateles asaccharophilus TaxID=582607 RepID=A0ABU2A1Z1_9BURK|nr:diguanylate cyclase [Roseateles asaccharophilus]MDR7331201.1 diguanylate cyclase (GGDEF)-like protein [Roseateles asaccharophilus]
MSNLLDLPAPLPHAGFDADAFDAAFAAQRQLAAAGAYDASNDALERLLANCPETELRRRADVLTLLAHQYPRQGRLTASARSATQALGLAEKLDDDLLRADALTSQAYVYGQLLMGSEALQSGMRALAVARRAGDSVREAWALNRVAIAYSSLENPAQACASAEQALEIASSTGSAEVLFSCHNNLAYFWLRRVEEAVALGDEIARVQAVSSARRTAQQATELARRSGSPFQVAVSLSNLVNALLAGDALDAALPLLNEFGHLAHDHGYRTLAVEADAQRAIFLRLKGEPLQAARILEALLNATTEPPPKLRRLLMRSLYETHKACGQHREALSWLEELVALDRQITRDNLVLQTEVLLIREQVAQAQARADSAAADARRERARAAHLESEQQRLREHAMALDRAAHEDVLTGLHNRRHAEFALPLLVEGARVAGQVISVAALDVDHFKRINDTHGHAIGDAVLQQLAQLLRHRLRSADLLARIGGEEFLAVLVGIAPQQAAEICERLRLAVAEHDWAATASGLVVRISVGIAGGVPPLAAGTLQNRADHALYAAKRGGRNRVHVD